MSNQNYAQLLEELTTYRQRVSQLEADLEKLAYVETALQSGETSPPQVLESAVDLLFTLDHDLRTTYWNPRLERYTGISAAAALRKPIEAVFPMAHHAIASYRRALETQQAQHFRETYTLEGRTTLLEISVYPTPHGLAVLAKDLTAFSHIEAQLRDSEAKYRSLIENLPIGIYRNTPGPEGQWLMANRACLQLLGYDSYEELAATKVCERYLNPAERQAFSERLSREGQVTNVELQLRRKDGTPLWVAVTARAQRNAHGQITYFEGTLEDITARKRQEKERSALAAVAKAISSTLELQPLLEDILRVALHAVPAAEKGSLALLIDAAHLQVRAVWGYRDPHVLGMTFPITWGFAGRALRERRAIWIKDVQHDPALEADAAGAPLAEVRELRSAIVMPLEVYGRAIGVISLESAASVVAFQQEDLQLLEAIAGPIALAIDNARLFEETRERLRELEILHETSQHLLSSRLDPEAIYTAIHQAVAAVMPCEAFVITLEHEGEYRAQYIFDKGGRWPAQDIPHGQGLTWQVIRQGATLLINDLEAEAPPSVLHFGAAEHVRAVLATPLRYGERCIGVISTQSYQPHIFNQQHQLLLETLAAQFTAVLENSALYQQMQFRLRELETIARISAALRSTPDRAGILNTIVDQLLIELQVEGAALERFDPLTNGFYVEKARGIWDSLNDTIIPAGAGLSAHLLEIRRPYLNNEAHLDPRLLHPELFGDCRAIAAAPLMVEDRLTGALWIGSRRLLTEDDLRLLAAIADIAANALHRAALQEKTLSQARQMTQIVDSVPEGVILLNTDGYILMANPLARKMLTVLTDTEQPLHIESLGGRTLAELLTSPPKGLWHEVRTAAQVFELIARPIVNGPNPEHWVLVIKDVTQERQIRELRQRQERLAAVGQLAAGIAHDFNNIMAVIVVYTHMALRSSTLPPQEQERLYTIMEQAHRATELIQQILDFGRQATIEPRPMDLVTFTKEHVRLLQRILPENISVLLLHKAEQLTIHADPTRIQQLLTNLAINARDAMPEGGILTISLNQLQSGVRGTPALPDLPAGNWAVLKVADTGTGIAPEILPHIFEPFFTTKEPGKGSGLGLAQVYGIVEQHGGYITAHNAPEGGAVFTVYLPLWEEDVPRAETLDLSQQPQGAGETILLVEDNEGLRAALAENLTQLNYHVLECANGKEALQLLERYADEVALILSDIVMPFMGGQALLHAVRARGWRMPFILISGHPIGKELEALLDQGLSCWLKKPLGLERLGLAVAAALQGKSCQEP